jgi:hypothetical protein
MAVSGKTAAPWEVPYLLESDIPDMGAGDKAIAERVHAILAGSAQQSLGWLKSGTEKQLIVCNASGVPQYVTASGDVTNDKAGVFTIGNEKVTAAKLAALAVTAAKLAAEAVETSKITEGAVTAAKVAAANKDGTTATPSMRTLGTGAQQAAAGNDNRLWGVKTGEPSNTGGVPAASKYLPITIEGVPYKVLLG